MRVVDAVDRVGPGREGHVRLAGGDEAHVAVHATGCPQAAGRVAAVGHIGVDVVCAALLYGAGQIAGRLGDDRGTDRRRHPVGGGADGVGRGGGAGEAGQGRGRDRGEHDGGAEGARLPAGDAAAARRPDGAQHGGQKDDRDHVDGGVVHRRGPQESDRLAGVGHHGRPFPGGRADERASQGSADALASPFVRRTGWRPGVVISTTRWVTTRWSVGVWYVITSPTWTSAGSTGTSTASDPTGIPGPMLPLNTVASR